MVDCYMEDWEISQQVKANRLALLKVKGRVKCSDCGLFGCICQTGLREFWDRKVFLKNKVSEVYRLSLKILNDLNRGLVVEKDLVRLKRKVKEVG